MKCPKCGREVGYIFVCDDCVIKSYPDRRAVAEKICDALDDAGILIQGSEVYTDAERLEAYARKKEAIDIIEQAMGDGQ
jgi:hypothetical protein